uniref:phenylalanine 4-monooxygenase n=1 Tax=Globodera rostochiensis TaxID=31243 RepID=A0A914GY85_GLORO
MDAKCCSNSEKLEKYMAEVKENMAKERSKEEMDDSDFCEEFTMCLDSYIADVDSNPAHTTIIFTLKEEAGALAETLKVFKQRHVNLTHIESRPSKVHVGCYEFMVEFAQDSDPDTLESIIRMFRRRAESAGLQAPRVQDFNSQIKQNKESVPWFPMKISDIDQFANRVLSYGAELDADHPGFTDPIYRARRKHFADIAANFRHGDKIPRVEYTAEEIGTWRTIYSELVKLYPSHACREFNYIFPLLQQNCGYGPDQIPQLQDVSDFLKDCTGFTLRPVAGLLSSRDFLAGLAFRVFHSTQYIRHSSKPHYTPEPDICHELLGHCPLYADPDFAQFSQEIGLASLGASDELVEKLATLYWFTVEFGICIQNGAKKAYGAGLLSSFGELEYALSGQPELASFDPPQTCQTKYPITSYQPKYFVAESFADAKNKLTAWTQSTARQFQVSYNPYTQRIEMLDNESAANKLVRDVKSQVSKLEEALRKLDRVKAK